MYIKFPIKEQKYIKVSFQINTIKDARPFILLEHARSQCDSNKDVDGIGRA